MRADLSFLAGSWLLTYLAHSTLLLAGVWALARRRRTTPAVRDALWKVGLVGGLITSSLQVGLGLEPWGGALSLRSPVATGFADRSASPLPDSAWGGQLVHPPAPEVAGSPAPGAAPAAAPTRDAPTPVLSDAGPAASGTRLNTAGVSPAERYLPSLVWAWAAVAGLLLSSYLLRRARAMREIGPRCPVREPGLVSMLETLRASGDVRRAIRLTSAPGLGSPVALGASEIVLPEAALTELDAEQQRSMLAHELAHLARRDPTWLAVACMVERIFFFQPLNRVARAGMQEAAEFLCDDWAVHRTGSGFSLATCLVKVAEWVDTTPRPVPLAGMAEHRSQLVTRIHRLIEGRAMPTAPRSLWFAAGAVVLLGITAVAAPGVAPVRPDDRNDAETQAEASGPAEYSAALAAAAADTDTALVSSARGTTTWSRMSSQLRALERRVAGTGRARADYERARAELRAAQIAPRAMSWAGPEPRVAIAPLAPLAVGVNWGRDRRQDTTSIAVPALILALKDADVDVRRAAANSLSNLQDPRAVPALVEALRDSDAEVRAAAARALGSLEDTRAVPGLVALLKDANKDVRQSALQALHSMPEGVPDEAILTAIADSDSDVREAAIGLALNRIQSHEDDETPADSRYVTAFVRLLSDASADTRRQAAEALGESRLKSAPSGLLAASRDKNADVRQSVAQALGSIGDAKAVSTLKEMLADGNADVREAAVEALGEIRDQSALEALVGALKSSDPAVRRAAAEALGQRGE